MGATIIETICRSCECKQAQAQDYLDDEIRNLRELRNLRDLRYSDMRNACDNLGLDSDYVEYFINTLA